MATSPIIPGAAGSSYGSAIPAVYIPGGQWAGNESNRNIGRPPNAVVVDVNPRGTGGGRGGAPSRSASEQQATVAGANSLIPIIYGRRRVGAKIAAVGMLGTDLVLLCIWCQGEIDAVESVQINDEATPAAVTVTSYVGNQSQAADATLIAAFGATYTDRLLGVCYSVLRVPAGAVAGFPRATALIRGMKVPRVEFSYVTLNGTSAYGAVADAASNDINEDFEVAVGLAATDWTPTADQVLASKWNTTGNQRSWRLLLKTTGALSLEVSTAGTAISATYTSSEVTTWTDTKCHFVRCRFVKTNGANSVASFATSEDGQAWTALGADQTGTIIATVFNSTADLRFGADHQGNYLAGNVWSLWIQTATKTVADLVLLEEAPSATTFPDATGQTWSLVNTSVNTHTAWSKLPGNCLVDLLTNTSYGLGRRVDIGTALQTVYLNADQIGTPAENRHELDLLLDTSTQADQWVTTLADAAHCVAEDGDGKVYLVRDWDDPVVKAFDTTNIAEGSLTWSKRGSRDQPTGVEVTWTNTTTTPWRDDVVTVYLPGVLGGSVPRRMSRISRPGITRYTEAYRRAVETLNDATTADVSVSFRTFDDAAAIRKGAIITVTHPVGFTAKKFRVTSIQQSEPGRWQIQGNEHDAARYSSAVVPGPTTVDTTLPSPNAPPAVTGLTATEDVYQVQTGYWASRLRVTWTEPATFPFVQVYAVEIRQGTTLIEAATVAKGSASYISNPLPENLLYTVTVQVISTTGARGAAATFSITNNGRAGTRPTNVPLLTAFEVGGEVRITWSPATDFDLTAHELRYTADYLGATSTGSLQSQWDAAKLVSTTLIDRVPTPTVRYDTRIIPAGNWRLYAKGLDSVRTATYPWGQESVTPAYFDLQVTSDANAFVAADYSFATPVLVNMTQHYDGLTGAAYWVTDMGETWNSLFPSTMNSYGNPLFTYHSSGSSGLSTEIKDYATALTGDWATAQTWQALSGAAGTQTYLTATEPTATVNVTAATNATPIVITTSAAHGWSTGDEIELASVGGNTNANGYRRITVTSTTQFSLQDLFGNNVAGNGAYTSGGTARKWTWTTSTPNLASKTTARYGRLTNGTTTTGTLLVTALGSLRCNVVARRESYAITTAASGPATVVLTQPYSKFKSISFAIATVGSYSWAYDRVEVSGGLGIQSGRVLRFFGAGTCRVDVGDHAVHDFGNGTTDSPFSVEAWVKVSALGAVQTIVGKGSGSPSGQWQLRIATNGRPRFALYDVSATAVLSIEADYLLPIDTWVHIAGTYSGSSTNAGMKIYVNAVLQTQTSVNAGTYVAMEVLTDPLVIGNQYFAGAYNTPFAGCIDEVRIWSTERSAADILANYRLEVSSSASGLVGQWKMNDGSGTTATDSTTNAKHGTLTAGTGTLPAWRPYDGFDLYAYVSSSGAQAAVSGTGNFEGV